MGLVYSMLGRVPFGLHPSSTNLRSTLLWGFDFHRSSSVGWPLASPKSLRLLNHAITSLRTFSQLWFPLDNRPGTPNFHVCFCLVTISPVYFSSIPLPSTPPLVSCTYLLSPWQVKADFLSCHTSTQQFIVWNVWTHPTLEWIIFGSGPYILFLSSIEPRTMPSDPSVALPQLPTCKQRTIIKQLLLVYGFYNSHHFSETREH